MPQRHHTTAGFTLIEMAIVVALFGLMVGGGLLGLGQFLDQIALKRSEKNLGVVEKALSLYVLQEGWLPCPDTNGDGLMEDDAAQEACSFGAAGDILQGMIPYRDLGLQLEDVLDGWNHRISYVVGYDLAAGRQLDPAVAASIQCTAGTRKYSEVENHGDIEPVEDAATQDWTADTPAAPRAAYALIVHGEQAWGAYNRSGTAQVTIGNSTAAEQHNGQAAGVRTDSGALQAQELTTGVNAYDDVVRSRTPAQILYDIGCRNDGT